MTQTLHQKIEALCDAGCYGQFSSQYIDQLEALVNDERFAAVEEAIPKAMYFGQVTDSVKLVTQKIISDMFPSPPSPPEHP